MPVRWMGRKRLRFIKNTEQNRLGRSNEDRLWSIFLGMMNSSEKPEWLRSVRRATWKEDHFQETDFVIETHDIGTMFVNAKSSHFHANQFNQQKRSRRIVAIPMDALLAAKPYIAEDFVLDILWKEYENIRFMRGDPI